MIIIEEFGIILLSNDIQLIKISQLGIQMFVLYHHVTSDYFLVYNHSKVNYFWDYCFIWDGGFLSLYVSFVFWS